MSAAITPLTARPRRTGVHHVNGAEIGSGALHNGVVTATRPPVHRFTQRQLEHLAIRAGHVLEDAPAAEVVRWAVETFGQRFVVTSSMQDSVLAHVASTVAPGVKVVFLDTGYHFAETIGTRDAVAMSLPIEVVNVTPKNTVAEQDAAYGKDLFKRDPDLCCAMRKVEPLNRALADVDSWATGLRRAESATRAGTPVVSWDATRGKVKVAPLARWTDDEVDAYVEEHQILVNPLQHDGYPSIGCWPCTRRVAPGDDPRSGRWTGFNKTECGIHE